MKVLVSFLVVSVLATVDGDEKARNVLFPVSRITKDSIVRNSNVRIYGGESAREGMFPFMVFVLMRGTNEDFYRCSGSLVTENWVLLAGHCVARIKSPQDFILAGGKADLSDYLFQRLRIPFEKDIEDSHFGVRERRVSAFYLHPQYDEDTLYYDVALLRLKTPFGDGVIPQSLSETRNTNGEKCTILGWGLSYGNEFDGHLKYVPEKDVVNPFYGCVHKHQGPFLCLRPGNGGICQGDSGSPLICRGRTWGVASHYLSADNQPQCGSSIEEYYSDVYPSLDWIRSYTNEGNLLRAHLVLGSAIVCLSRLL